MQDLLVWACFIHYKKTQPRLGTYWYPIKTCVICQLETNDIKDSPARCSEGSWYGASQYFNNILSVGYQTLTRAVRTIQLIGKQPLWTRPKQTWLIFFIDNYVFFGKKLPTSIKFPNETEIPTGILVVGYTPSRIKHLKTNRPINNNITTRGTESFCLRLMFASITYN